MAATLPPRGPSLQWNPNSNVTAAAAAPYVSQPTATGPPPYASQPTAAAGAPYVSQPTATAPPYHSEPPWNHPDFLREAVEQLTDRVKSIPGAAALEIYGVATIPEQRIPEVKVPVEKISIASVQDSVPGYSPGQYQSPEWDQRSPTAPLPGQRPFMLPSPAMPPQYAQQYAPQQPQYAPQQPLYTPQQPQYIPQQPPQYAPQQPPQQQPYAVAQQPYYPPPYAAQPPPYQPDQPYGNTAQHQQPSTTYLVQEATPQSPPVAVNQPATYPPPQGPRAYLVQGVPATGGTDFVIRRSHGRPTRQHKPFLRDPSYPMPQAGMWPYDPQAHGPPPQQQGPAATPLVDPNDTSMVCYAVTPHPQPLVRFSVKADQVDRGAALANPNVAQEIYGPYPRH